MTDWKKVQTQLESFAGPEDRIWYRGAEGTPYFHLGYKKHSSSIELEMGRKLLDLIKERKPKNLTELGTNIGYSACWQLLGIGYNGFGHLTTFDVKNYSDETPWLWTAIEGLPTDSLTFVNSSVWDGIDRLPKTIDWAFIDSSHDKDATEKELDVLTPRMSIGGLIVLHDIFLCGYVNEVARAKFENPKQWEYVEIQEGRGLGIAEKLL